MKKQQFYRKAKKVCVVILLIFASIFYYMKWQEMNTIYNSAIESFNNKQYYNALKQFQSINKIFFIKDFSNELTKSQDIINSLKQRIIKNYLEEDAVSILIELNDYYKVSQDIFLKDNRIIDYAKNYLDDISEHKKGNYSYAISYLKNAYKIRNKQDEQIETFYKNNAIIHKIVYGSFTDYNTDEVIVLLSNKNKSRAECPLELWLLSFNNNLHEVTQITEANLDIEIKIIDINNDGKNELFLTITSGGQGYNYVNYKIYSFNFKDIKILYSNFGNNYKGASRSSKSTIYEITFKDIDDDNLFEIIEVEINIETTVLIDLFNYCFYDDVNEPWFDETIVRNEPKYYNFNDKFYELLKK